MFTTLIIFLLRRVPISDLISLYIGLYGGCSESGVLALRVAGFMQIAEAVLHLVIETCFFGIIDIVRNYVW